LIAKYLCPSKVGEAGWHLKSEDHFFGSIDLAQNKLVDRKIALYVPHIRLNDIARPWYRW
jgi:hypothetical protein